MHNLFIGPYDYAGDPEYKQLFNSYNFDVVINVMNDGGEYTLNDNDDINHKIEYYHMPMSDSLKHASFEPNGVTASQVLYRSLKQKKKVYIHCAMGKSRSVAVALFCLCKYFNFKYSSAKSILKYQRRCIGINPLFLTYIRDHIQNDKSAIYGFDDKDKFASIVDNTHIPTHDTPLTTPTSIPTSIPTSTPTPIPTPSLKNDSPFKNFSFFPTLGVVDHPVMTTDMSWGEYFAQDSQQFTQDE